MEQFLLPEPVSGVGRLADSAVDLGPGTTEFYFLASTPGSTSTIRTRNAGFTWYRLAVPYLIDGDPFSMNVCFSSGILSLISMSIVSGEQDPTWSTWSEAIEAAKNKRHQEILQKRYGVPPYQFHWGEILAAYDPRAGASTIAISYT